MTNHMDRSRPGPNKCPDRCCGAQEAANVLPYGILHATRAGGFERGQVAWFHRIRRHPSRAGSLDAWVLAPYSIPRGARPITAVPVLDRRLPVLMLPK